jgi:pentatricopeptide repeat protein
MDTAFPLDVRAHTEQHRGAQQFDKFLNLIWHTLCVEAPQTGHVQDLDHWINTAERMSVKINTEVCNAFMRLYVSAGRLGTTEGVWEAMMQRGVQPNVQTFTRMIRAHGRRRNTDAVERWTMRAQLHGMLEKDEVQHACMLAWADCRQVGRVLQWVEERAEPIPAPFMRAFVVALGKAGFTDAVRDFVQGVVTSWADPPEMVPRLLELDLASAVVRYHPDAKVAESVFAACKKRAAIAATGDRSDRIDAAELYSALVARRIAEGRYKKAIKLVDTVLGLGLPPTPSLCVEVLRLRAALENPEGAEEVWRDMLQNNILLEGEMFCAALQEFGRHKDINSVHVWMKRAVEHSFDKHPDVQAAIFGALTACGHPEHFRELVRLRKAHALPQ